MKIGIVAAVDWLKGKPIGGTSRVILSLLPYVKSNIYLFGVSIKNLASEQYFTFAETCKVLPLYEIKFPAIVPLRLKALFNYWLKKKVVLFYKPDVIYAHSPESALPFLIGKKDVPVVFHQHGSFNPVENTDIAWARNRLFKIIFNLIIQFIYTRADAIIAIDKICYSQATKSGAAKKTFLITNPVDRALFKPNDKYRLKIRNQLKIAEQDTVILFAGRLSRKKQVHLIIEALYRGRQKGLDWKLVIAGEGPLKKDLKEQTKRLKLTAWVHFIGSVSNNQIPAIYNSADVVALPSKDEGIPMMLLEALACGIPVVATNVGGIPEIIKSNLNGVIIAEQNADCLFEGIERCLKMNWEKEAIVKSIAPWSGEKTALKIQQILQGTVK
jgi:glycosyltransferase involved in cell wall biosynthesis